MVEEEPVHEYVDECENQAVKRARGQVTAAVRRETNKAAAEAAAAGIKHLRAPLKIAAKQIERGLG